MVGIVISLRLRSIVSDAELASKEGKLLTDDDYNVLATGPCTVAKPDGSPLCVYLPGWITAQVRQDVYPHLHELKSIKTENRGKASGTQRARSSDPTDTKRARALPLPSAIIGSIDPMGERDFCRLTAWTGRNVPKFKKLWPMFEQIARAFELHVPQRYEAQMFHVKHTQPDWVIPGTPFTTVTVNNTYPTGVHTDKGDLHEGFSTLAVIRKGSYVGGTLVFPRFRIGVDLEDGDVLLMDAHEFHGNTPIVRLYSCEPPQRPCGACAGCVAERISVVSYFRTKVEACGSAEQEGAKALAWSDRRAMRA